MPLKAGSSSKTVSTNIRELHSGKTYAKTAAKFGPERANKQAVAIALEKARGRAWGGPISGLPPIAGMMGANQFPGLGGAPSMYGGMSGGLGSMPPGFGFPPQFMGAAPQSPFGPGGPPHPQILQDPMQGGIGYGGRIMNPVDIQPANPSTGGVSYGGDAQMYQGGQSGQGGIGLGGDAQMYQGGQAGQGFPPHPQIVQDPGPGGVALGGDAQMRQQNSQGVTPTPAPALPTPTGPGAVPGPPPPQQAQRPMPSGMMARGGTASLNRAAGGIGSVKPPNLTPTWMERQEARSITKGPILSNVPGRTDAHATHVPSGSYVIPADIVSGRGQGNTLAGTHTLQALFKMGPYSTGMPNIVRGHGAPGGMKMSAPNTTFHAKGGKASDANEGAPVRVNLAGGEIVVPPENLRQAVHPDLKTAHEIMDRWVLSERKKLRKTLGKLPGPAKD